ncbi:TIGR04282 family arsenosugar biosynthesis glycosyltransferase [Pyruvatibacter sp.]|uniref:TIGR04282 family arsenosugar biosynthesis glycosyltransferase n=1 Tax=Pyruvatibacter sp. TaxID=1981328 RepID=UPI0032EAAFFE
MQKHLVIMAKAPALGRVKTRLARDVGPVEATRFYRVALARLIRRMAADTRWTTVVAASPDNEAVEHAHWLETAHGVLPQAKGDLGARMQRVFDHMPPGPVVIIGSDIPDIRPHHIAQAFSALGGNDVVIGPSVDGGYWLIGQKRLPRVLRGFAGVEWSSGRERAQTSANFSEVRVKMLDELSDVDSGTDHARWRERCG